MASTEEAPVRVVTEKSEVVSGGTVEIGGSRWRTGRLLGKGKGGYSWLALEEPVPGREPLSAVLKQIHHEPCAYYRFGDKFMSELNDYAALRRLGVPLPEMYASDRNRELILKEYIDGESAMDLARRNAVAPGQIAAVGALSAVLREAGLNIDWYPANFIVRRTDDKIFYIDYECNRYDEKWSFENWGIQYWGAAQSL